MRRLLGLFDVRIYTDDVLDVGDGAKPVLDYLAGDDVNWRELKLSQHTPVRGRDYGALLA